jgi:hypothetical protein
VFDGSPHTPQCHGIIFGQKAEMEKHSEAYWIQEGPEHPMSENEDGEFGESRYERSNLENPEQSYRRGFQQGARAVVEALKDTRDPATLDTLKQYVGITLAE